MLTPIWWLTKAAQSLRASSLSTLLLSSMLARLPQIDWYDCIVAKFRGRRTVVIVETWTAVIPSGWRVIGSVGRRDGAHGGAFVSEIGFDLPRMIPWKCRQNARMPALWLAPQELEDSARVRYL
jgi:hypothetical protein